MNDKPKMHWLRQAPTIAHTWPNRQFTVWLEDASPRNIAAGISELSRRLKKECYSAYVELVKPGGCECEMYGPVRRVAMWSHSPGDGGYPRYVHRLDVSVFQ